MNAPERAKQPLVVKFMRHALGSCLVLTALPVLGTVAGYLYIPSPEWIALSRKAALIGGAFVAILFLCSLFTGDNDHAYGDPGKLFLAFALPFVGFVMGYIIVISGVPMVGSLLAGRQVERVYTVASMVRSRGCWNAITLLEPPFLTSKLCGYSSELRDSLWPRDRVVISGRGWKWGLIATDVRRAD